MMAGPEVITSLVVREELEAGQLWLLTLNAPKGNVLDMAMCAALQEQLEEADRTPSVKGLILTGAGRHFSFGASVQEHLPGTVELMLPAFHRLIRTLFTSGFPTIAAVSGCCLGGGLELAAACDRIIVAPDATLGQPEIRLGVFAPVGSLLLTRRMGPAGAADLCLSGRQLDGLTACELHLAEAASAHPVGSALDYARQSWLPHSAATLRIAVRALRAPWLESFFTQLDYLEQMYLTDLMATSDAQEGLSAFLAKRPPRWSNA